MGAVNWRGQRRRPRARQCTRRKAADLAVYLFTTDERLWSFDPRLPRARPDAAVGDAGDYAFPSVAAGDHYIVAVTRASLAGLTREAQSAKLDGTPNHCRRATATQPDLPVVSLLCLFFQPALSIEHWALGIGH